MVGSRNRLRAELRKAGSSHYGRDRSAPGKRRSFRVFWQRPSRTNPGHCVPRAAVPDTRTRTRPPGKQMRAADVADKGTDQVEMDRFLEPVNQPVTKQLALHEGDNRAPRPINRSRALGKHVEHPIRCLCQHRMPQPICRYGFRSSQE